MMYQKQCAHTKISAHTDYKKLEGTLLAGLPLRKCAGRSFRSFPEKEIN